MGWGAELEVMTLAYTRCAGPLGHPGEDGQLGAWKSGLEFKWKVGSRDTRLEVIHISLK